MPLGHSFDITNDDPAGNVGIGMYPTWPFPNDKLIVGGNIGLDPVNSSIERKLWAHSPISQLGIYSNDNECNGAAIRLHAVHEPNEPGLVDLMSQGVGGSDPAFLLRTLEICQPYNRMVITRDGLSGIGHDINPSLLNAADRLTVDHSMALVSTNDADPRDIRARCADGQLNIMSGDNTTDGSGIQLFGSNNPGIGIGGPNTPAGITFTANYSNPANEVAYKFCHFKNLPTAISMNTSFTISNQLTARFGPGMPTSERLTVDGNLYLYDQNDAPRGIVGYSNTGAIDVSANTNNTDGSRIRLFARNNSTNPGQIHFSALSANASNKAFIFSTKNTGTNVTSDKLVMEIDGKVHMSNDLDFNLISTSTGANIRAYSTNSLNLYSKSSDADGSALQIKDAQMRFVAGNAGAATASAYSFLKRDNAGNTWKPLLDIHNDGKVVIGDNANINTTGAYKLFVEDGIMTERVNVAIKNSSAWHDEVFEIDYQLMPLAELSEYTSKNKHLPEIPSAAEVVKTGVDVGQMESLLLKKVEELTLYVIQQQKQIEAQNTELKQVKEKLAKGAN